MITGIGWFMHKHAVGIYSSVPRETGLRSHDLADEKDPVVGNEPVKQIEEASGKGFIETYTVIYSRSGRPEKAVIYGMTEKGYRFVAQTPERSEIFKALATENHVGKAVRLSHDSRKRLNVAEVL
jgi:acetyl-CoA C-acetyltransferase